MTQMMTEQDGHHESSINHALDVIYLYEKAFCYVAVNTLYCTINLIYAQLMLLCSVTCTGVTYVAIFIHVHVVMITCIGRVVIDRFIFNVQ